MNSDPFLVGVASTFPNQNSSTVPTVWEEDTELAAQQGIPCGSGTMLRLTKRWSDQQFLPGGAINPCPETAGTCLHIENIRVTSGVSEQRSSAMIGTGLVGGSFVGGIPGAPGLGLVGIGRPGDGVRGVTATGHGVAGFTASPNINHAGVLGEASSGAVGVLGQSLATDEDGNPTPFGIGVRGQGNRVGVVGDGASGVAGIGTATGVDGRGRFGVVGRGEVAGVWGQGAAAAGGATSGIGVVGIPGPLSGGTIPFAGDFRGSVRVTGRLIVNGGVFVNAGAPKSAVVTHPDGSQRVMYAVEAPQSWFEDVGRAQLRQGVAQVDLDPDFAAITGLGDDYHVFLTPEGPSNGLYVAERTSSGFEIREQGDGTSEISFSYRITVLRTDIRAGRMEPFNPPSEAGERVDVEHAELPTSPPPAPPDEPAVAPKGTPPAEPRQEADAFGHPPADWPRDVPWPPVVDSGAR